jgi:outer membrane protein assembly factor BamB
MKPPTRNTQPGALVVLALIGCAGCGSDPASPVPAASATAALPATAGSADWPMYGRNASRTSHNPDETRLVASAIESLVERWQVGIGMGRHPPSGTPTVAGGRVFVGSSVATGRNFFAFDAATGRALWSVDIGHSRTGHPDGVGIGATAAVSEGIVVAGGGDGAYYGLRAETGEILWRHAMDVGDSGFAWCSPLIVDGRAYIGIASEYDNPSVAGELRALDLTTGRVLARQRFVPEGRRGAGIWNSPALSPDGRTLFLATGEDYQGYDGPWNRALVSLDLMTLEIRQADKQGVPDVDGDWATTPVVFHDRTGRVLVGANHKDRMFYAYAADSIAAGPLWRRATGRSIGFMAAYDETVGEGGTLLIGGDDARLFAVDPATGADRWPPVTIETLHGNMAIANGLVFVPANGKVFVLDEARGTTLRVLAPVEPGRSFSGVAVTGGMIYWLSGRTLNAWGRPQPSEG